MPLVIRPERAEDITGIRHVHKAAFDTAAESDLVDALRQQARPLISLIAVDDITVVGHILFSPVHREAEVLALLNHPSIAQIYGLEQSTTGGIETLASIREIVDGDEPSKLIARGAMAVDEAGPAIQSSARPCSCLGTAATVAGCFSPAC